MIKKGPLSSYISIGEIFNTYVPGPFRVLEKREFVCSPIRLLIRVSVCFVCVFMSAYLSITPALKFAIDICILLVHFMPK